MTLLAGSSLEVGRFRAYGPRHIDEIGDRYGLSEDAREAIRLISLVLPFRVNDYVLSQLIDWSRVPDDPIYRLVFPQHGMLSDEQERILSVLSATGDRSRLQEAVRTIRADLNPHPSGQKELNVPTLGDEPIPGLQHKYRETVLYFPSQGQTCHAYCTYCFRWAQFVGDADLRFAAPNPDQLIAYLGRHPDVSDVLITGGDPMIMTTERLRGHIEPLLAVDTVRTIRIGSKSPAYWPYRYTTDPDADDLLRLFERVVASGRTLALMAHYSHPRELETDEARAALARVRGTGAVVYCQAPLIKYVNDDVDTWARLWRLQFAAGAVPYYQFVERDTGPHAYFRVPLARSVEIFHGAFRTLPGLARTVRGPVMSATPGKVIVDGVEETPQGRYFRLRFMQARQPSLVGRPFRAHYSPTAAWLTELELDPDTPDDIMTAIDGGAARIGRWTREAAHVQS
ncbi:KamA family radical SAM protein [Microbispora sp. H10670]|uniref:KamA family radical SAM protein n=1 Tax=Microbispora sp. H10670 TaxID=2729108 RepID=UPI0015FF0D41|nr:lysine 2,3-aminomutase [Microbispora sp. H10670]